MLTIFSILVIIIIVGTIGLLRTIQPQRHPASQPIRVQRTPLRVTIKRG